MIFTEVGFHLKSGFKKIVLTQMVLTLGLDSPKNCAKDFSILIGQVSLVRYAITTFSSSLKQLGVAVLSP